MGSLDLSPSNGHGVAINISSEVTAAAVIFLFLIAFIILFLYLYNKYYLDGSSSPRRRAQLISAAGHATNPGRGVEFSAVQPLPVTVYKTTDFKDGLECPVCLCEITDGQTTRLLPKCKHGFHLECIDMWFRSHYTCPLCRCPVGPEAAIAVGESAPTTTISADIQPTFESPALPTNVLFWGNQERVNTGVSLPREINSRFSAPAYFCRTLVSVPSRTTEGFPSPISPFLSNTLLVENLKLPVEEAMSPGTSKLLSLRRILSRGKKFGGSSSTTPIREDIEQGLVASGGGSSSILKTPPSS